MATASSPSAARATIGTSLAATARRALPAAVVIVGVAVVLRLVYDPWFLNYDARYALLWARDLAHGFSPEYTADFAPTPHPLQTAVSLLALPFGGASGSVLSWLILLLFGVLVWLTYRLGATLFSAPVGAVAALVVLTRPALERDAVLGYQDVAFAALVVGAVLLEARRPKRGVAVLAVLAVAGLVRPDAWALSGLYFLYLVRDLSWRRRLAYAALVAVGPVVWALSDLAVTGDALHSLHGTADLAEEADRRRHVHQVPRWAAQYFAFTLREPLIVGVPIGLAFAWLYRRRPAALPVAVIVATTAVFAIGPIFGLPLIGRYVRTPSVLLALFYGLAVFGWRLLPDGRERRRWAYVGAFAAALSIAFLPWHAGMLHGLEQRMERDGGFYADLRDVGEAPAVRAAFATCKPLTAADHRPIPYVRFWLGGPPGSVGTTESDASPLGRMLLVPRRTFRARRFYKDAFPPTRVPAGWSRVFQNRSWRVFTAPGCQRS